MGDQVKHLGALQGGDCLDFMANSNPKCPHCGHDCNVNDMEAWQLYEEGEHDLECPSCDGAFIVSTSVKFSFSTDEQEADHD
jgi:hypothetical protein